VSERLIVARMRPSRSGAIIAAIFVLTITLYGVAWIGRDSDFITHRKAQVLFALLVCGPCLMAVVWMGVRQLIFHHGEMVWIEDGKVIYLSGLVSAIPLNEIETVAPGTTDNWPHNKAIVLKRRTGEETAIALWSLSEPEDLILARIQHALKNIGPHEF
jgi:hypothetical protein